MTLRPTLVLGVLGALLLTDISPAATPTTAPFVSKRPRVERRTFRSDAVEALIVRVKARIADPELAWMFENCLPNTLDTTVKFQIKDGKPDTFIITGDIPAMWLRDSTAQVETYIPLCPQDAHLSELIAGLIRRQASFIRLDPYANAFYRDATKTSPHVKTDRTMMLPGVHERKWELDSLCYPIRLSYLYWKSVGDAPVFDDDWKAAMRLAVDTMVEQQRKTGPGPYTFTRVKPPSTSQTTKPAVAPTAAPAPAAAAAPARPPIKPNGMICSNFRPSDDDTRYLFNVPQNLFAVVSLRQLAEMLDGFKARDNSGLAARCRALADEVEQAVLTHGVVERPGGLGKMYAYECNGLGQFLLMDDANAPGLSSLTHLGYKTVDDPLFRNTRAFAQSAANPFYYKGTAAEGLGSPHTPRRHIWPIGVIVRALASNDDDEIRQCLATLKRGQNGRGFMNESFHSDDPAKFTRSWFSWANNLFGDLIVKLEKERPYLLTGAPKPPTS